VSSREDILGALRGRLIVSVQAEATSVLNTPETIALLARCAVQNGAAGVRIEGVERVRAVRAAVDVPVIGIIKCEHVGFAPYITSTRAEIAEIAATGAAIVAFDATQRERADAATVAALVAESHARGLVAMADCSDPADAALAAGAGADIVATTLAGYTAATHGRPLPALDVVAAATRHHPFVVCEGGAREPRHVRAAFEAGASAVVVGTAITNVDLLVRRFVAAVPRTT
jgi:N-acylglucosamine-6-phosphate 2-epimerase